MSQFTKYDDGIYVLLEKNIDPYEKVLNDYKLLNNVGNTVIEFPYNIPSEDNDTTAIKNTIKQIAKDANAKKDSKNIKGGAESDNEVIAFLY